MYFRSYGHAEVMTIENAAYVKSKALLDPENIVFEASHLVRRLVGGDILRDTRPSYMLIFLIRTCSAHRGESGREIREAPVTNGTFH